MSGTVVSDLISALTEKGALLREMRRLLQEEQSCLVSLDLARMEENQQEITGALDRMERLSDDCRDMIGSIGSRLGLPGNATLSPIIARVGQPDQIALKEAKSRIDADAQALGS